MPHALHSVRGPLSDVRLARLNASAVHLAAAPLGRLRGATADALGGRAISPGTLPPGGLQHERLGRLALAHNTRVPAGEALAGAGAAVLPGSCAQALVRGRQHAEEARMRVQGRWAPGAHTHTGRTARAGGQIWLPFS